MKTLTHEELNEVAGGWDPYSGYHGHGYGGYNGYNFGTSGSYVYEQYYRESLSFDYNTYGNSYYGGYGHGHGHGCGHCGHGY